MAILYSNKILKKVSDYIKQTGMLSSGDSIVIGLSGGRDSVCLLYFLKEMQERENWKIYALHVNHGLREGTAKRDEDFTRELCRELEIPLKVVSPDVKGLANERGISVETAGREARYAAFLQYREETGADKIVTAHHMNDSCETFIWNLCRGSGLKGLSGIEAYDSERKIARPLLCLTREEITEFFEESGLSYVDDETNLENDYTRNRIRNEVLTYLEENVNSESGRHIAEASNVIGELHHFAEKCSEPYIEKIKRDEKGTFIPLEVFKESDRALWPYIIAGALKKSGLSTTDFYMKHYEAVYSLVKGRTGAAIDLPGDLSAFKDYSGIRFTGKEGIISEAENGFLEKNILKGDKKLNINEIPNYRYTKFIDYDKIKDDLIIRTRMPGDFIVINDRGNSKSLKKFFTDEKIPSYLRDSIRLVADGNEIVWIIGYRLSARYKLTEGSKNIMKLEWVRNGR